MENSVPPTFLAVVTILTMLAGANSLDMTFGDIPVDKLALLNSLRTSSVTSISVHVFPSFDVEITKLSKLFNEFLALFLNNA